MRPRFVFLFASLFALVCSRSYSDGLLAVEVYDGVRIRATEGVIPMIPDLLPLMKEFQIELNVDESMLLDYLSEEQLMNHVVSRVSSAYGIDIYETGLLKLLREHVDSLVAFTSFEPVFLLYDKRGAREERKKSKSMKEMPGMSSDGPDAIENLWGRENRPGVKDLEVFCLFEEGLGEESFEQCLDEFLDKALIEIEGRREARLFKLLQDYCVAVIESAYPNCCPRWYLYGCANVVSRNLMIDLLGRSRVNSMQSKLARVDGQSGQLLARGGQIDVIDLLDFNADSRPHSARYRKYYLVLHSAAVIMKLKKVEGTRIVPKVFKEMFKVREGNRDREVDAVLYDAYRRLTGKDFVSNYLDF